MSDTRGAQFGIFEVDNARNLSMNRLVSTFIPTQAFWRLLTPKHHVVLGARGQGKTALAKMLSHDHLVCLAKTRKDDAVRSIVAEQSCIGIYLPTRLEWVGGVKNKIWLDEKDRESLFNWRLNIASCIAFLTSVRSCLSEYVKDEDRRARLEDKISSQLHDDWIDEVSQCPRDLGQLQRLLEDVDYKRNRQILKARALGGLPKGEEPVGISFDMELFYPLRRGIRQVSRLLELNPDCAWLLCIDEAEFLDTIHHRIINSHMRAYPDNLFIKMTTMPYCHHTLATNIGADLVNGQDFEYINMDSDPVLLDRCQGEPDSIGTRFGRDLFKRFTEAYSGSQSTVTEIQEVLGQSRLLDPHAADWGPGSENMARLFRYGNVATIERARKLQDDRKRFRNEIAAKISGALIIRDEVDNHRGNAAYNFYSGAKMAIRCADNNPRRLIRIYNAILGQSPKKAKWLKRQGKHSVTISAEDQTRRIRSLSKSILDQTRSLEEVGPNLYSFLSILGKYMSESLHKQPLSTDQISSIIVDGTISDADWKLICVAVGHGLLHANIPLGSRDEMPWMEGKFHLSYALAPHFLLLPRRGRSVRLSSIRRYAGMESSVWDDAESIQTEIDFSEAEYE
jgi:hypothetical protein